MSLFPLPLPASKSALITYSTVTVRSDNQNIIWLKQISSKYGKLEKNPSIWGARGGVKWGQIK